MVKLEPKHLALWKRAAAVTVPSVITEPPNYRAHHRQPAEKREPADDRVEAEAPELEGVGTE